MSGTTILQSGSSGQTAEVNDNNQLHVRAETQPRANAASANGDAFSMGTGTVNLTTATISYLSWISNEDTVDWFVEDIIAILGASTGGSGSFGLTFNIGATAGTLISAGADGFAGNLNLGSPKQLAVTFKIGVEGSTLTNGAAAAPLLLVEQPTVRAISSDLLIIPPGATLGLGLTPPTGNTSMDVSLSTTIYRGES